MDSISNLPLLEISNEDDSLLFDVPAATTDVFSCSPLLSLRSNTPRNEGRKGLDADSENPSSSPNNGANKENTNWSKPEAQKLSVEPQKMKRKKKGGGYNLRKSLAWDRAFFTEQGVLNPTELSMISGAATANAELEVIHEEEESGGSSLALQEIEENLFKQSDGVHLEDRKIGATVGLSPKPGASAKSSLAPASMAKRKVLAVNDVVGNRSKRSACPRPPVASSCSPETVKAPSKELKVTRIPGPKSNVSVSTTTARSGKLTSASSKRNQNAHPVPKVQKNARAGVKGLSKNPRTVPSKPKVDLADKSSVAGALIKRSGKHLGNPVSETNPPSRLHKSGTESNKVLEVCLPPSVSDTVEKKQQTQSQTTKLSGLRMPSPSLGFFSQAKAPGSHSQLQKSSKPCKPAQSNIPKFRNLEANSVNEARLSHAPGIRSEIVKGAVKNYIEKDVKPEPSMQMDNKQIAGVEVEYDPRGSEKISKQERVENILEHVNVKSEQGELHKSENVSSMEDGGFPRHEKRFLSESHAQEQSEKEADHPNIFSNGDQYAVQDPQSMHYHSMQRTSTEKDSISNTSHNAMGQDENEQIKLLACDVLTSNESLVLQEKHDTSFKDSGFSGDFKEYNSVKTALSNSSLTHFSQTVLGASIQGIPCTNTEQVNGGTTDFVISGGDVQVHSLNGNHSVYCNETTQSNLEAVNQQLPGEQLKTTSSSAVGEISSKKENESHVNSCEVVCMATLSSKCSPMKLMHEINCASKSEQKIAEIEDCQFPVDGQSGFIQRRPVDEGYEQVIDSKAMNDSTQGFELDSLTDDCITVSATACCTKVSNVSQAGRPSHENNVGNLHCTSQLCPTVKSDFDSGENDMSTKNCCAISELQHGEDSPSGEISTHYYVQHDVPGNSEQQGSTFTYSKYNKMLCEDEILVLNHDHLLDQSEFSEVSADFISNIEDSIGDGAENPSGILQHTLVADVHGNPEQQYSMFTYSKASEMLCEDEILVVNHGHLFDQSEFSEVSADFISDTKDYIGGGTENPSGLLQHTPLADVPGNSEQQDSMFTNSKANGMLCQDEILDLNHGHLLDQSEFSEVPADFISNTKDSISGGAENPSCLLQHTLLAQSVQEFDHANSEMEESHVEDAQVQSFNENPVAYNCNSKHCLAVTNDQFPSAGNNNIIEDSHRSDFQRPGAVVGVDSQNDNNILHLDGDLLPTNIASSEEIKKKNLFEGALEGCDIYTSKHKASDQHHIQAMLENRDGNFEVDEMAELLQMDGAKKGSSDILPLVDTVISSKCDSSIEVSKGTLTEVVAWKSEEQCSLSQSSNLPASDNPTVNARIPQVCEVSSLNSKGFSDESETNSFEKDESPNTNMQQQTKGGIHFENSVTKSKQEVPTVKPPANAAPFSDEWLAAIEAAGEEILTMKSGAVQNSPPDKPQHEPGPWSPVKRKNQGIGPFDCTKHNIQHSSS